MIKGSQRTLFEESMIWNGGYDGCGLENDVYTLVKGISCERESMAYGCYGLDQGNDLRGL